MDPVTAAGSSSYFPLSYRDSPIENRDTAKAYWPVCSRPSPNLEVTAKHEPPTEWTAEPWLRQVDLALLWTNTTLAVWRRTSCLLPIPVKKTQRWGFTEKPTVSWAAFTHFIHLLCQNLCVWVEVATQFVTTPEQTTFSLWKVLPHLHVNSIDTRHWRQIFQFSLTFYFRAALSAHMWPNVCRRVTFRQQWQTLYRLVIKEPLAFSFSTIWSAVTQ